MRRRTMTSEGDTHEYVEIAGIKWAKTNIGAEKETDYGLYFQWGDTQGYTSSQCGTGNYQKQFKWVDYKFGKGTSSPGTNGMVKYNASDGKTVLDLSDDAARLYWGGYWRMPTIEELVALNDATNAQWIVNYNGSGISGRLLTDKTDPSKTLFLPAAGSCYTGTLNYESTSGLYMSSSLYSDAQFCYIFYYQYTQTYLPRTNQRHIGHTIRPVLDDSNNN